MGSKTKRATARTTPVKHSRAALWTIQLAVETAADSARRLGALQDRMFRGHQAALWTLQMARHHSLKGGDLQLVEEGIRRLAERVEWPSSIRRRTRREHLERPLTDTESGVVRNLAASATRVASGMLDISEQLDDWYGGVILMAVAAARSALSGVTVEAHKRRAAKLMDRLDLLCRDERVAWAFTDGLRRSSSHAGRTVH
jgi:hypothetical protein